MQGGPRHPSCNAITPPPLYCMGSWCPIQHLCVQRAEHRDCPWASKDSLVMREVLKTQQVLNEYTLTAWMRDAYWLHEWTQEWMRTSLEGRGSNKVPEKTQGREKILCFIHRDQGVNVYAWLGPNVVHLKLSHYLLTLYIPQYNIKS